MAGATGPLTSANNKSSLASEVELGVGGTTSWKLCALSQATSLGMFFEVAASHGTVLESGQILCLQFQTQYQHPSGLNRLRVTTVARPWAEPNAVEVWMGAAAHMCCLRLGCLHASGRQAMQPVSFACKSLQTDPKYGWSCFQDHAL